MPHRSAAASRGGPHLAGGGRRGGHRRALRVVGRGGAQGPGGADAPAGRARSRSHDPTRRGNLAGTGAGPRRGNRSASGPSDDRTPAQPHRVPERGPRPARSRRQRRSPAAARRRQRGGIRQQRRYALDVDDPDGALPDGRPAHQSARGRRPGHGVARRHLPCAPGGSAGRPYERESAVGDARRSRGGALLPAGRGVRVQDRPAPQFLQLHPGARQYAAPARCPRRQGARRVVHGRRRIRRAALPHELLRPQRG